MVNGDFEESSGGWTDLGHRTTADAQSGNYSWGGSPSYSDWFNWQTVDLTDVDEITFWIKVDYTGSSSTDDRVTVWIFDMSNNVRSTPVSWYGSSVRSHEGDWTKYTADVSSLNGNHKIRLYTFGYGGFKVYYDNFNALGPKDYNSYSTGSIKLDYNSGLFVGDDVSFLVDVDHVDNPDLDEHFYFTNDSAGNYFEIADSESLHDYSFSLVPDEPTTRTVNLCEGYQYYDEDLGYSVVKRDILDTITVDIVERPASSKSEIWTGSDLIVNNTIRFYWDIENFNIGTYDFFVSVRDESGNFVYDRHKTYFPPGLGYYWMPSGYFDVNFTQSGTYTAYLERCLDDTYSDYYVMDQFSFTISMEDPEDPADSPDIPDPEIPDNLTDPIQNDSEYEPPELDPGDGNTTINDSVLQGYYNGVDNAVNSLHGALGGFVYTVTSPVRSMKEGVSTIAGVGTSTMNSVSLMFGPAGTILTALFSALPESYITTGTFSIFLVIVAWIWRGVQ